MTIPVLLLACVWAFQLMLTQVYALTPWKGGGFGMFSVTLVRDLKIEAYDRQGRAVLVDPLSFSKRHQRLNLRTLWMPNDGIMCHVAERILKSPLVEVSFEKSVQFDAQQGA